MATSSVKSNTHVRSISLPCRSHPDTARIEEELNKLKTWEASATPTTESIVSGLSGLQGLYKSIDELLANSSITHRALSQHQLERWFDGFSNGSVKLLDICGIITDILSQIKEHARAVQSALRRRKGDSSIESSITAYTCFRNKAKKDAKRLILALKNIDNEIGASMILEYDPHLSSVVSVLREASELSITIFQSLLMFLSVPLSKPKPTTRWSLVSKLILNSGKVACESHQHVTEVANADAAVSSLRKCGSSEGGEKMQAAQNRLEALEACIETIENGLELTFRNLIRTRVSLLNIISQ